MEDERGFHLGAGLLQRQREPLEGPLVQVAGVLFAAAEVLQQREQGFAFAGLRRGGPAAPEVAADQRIRAGGVEADFFHAHHRQAAAEFDGVPGAFNQHVHNVGLGD